MREKILQEVKDERERQIALAFKGSTEDFDRANTKNDWVSYITTYAGRATDKLYRDQQDFRSNMIKVAALAVAAVEACDKGYL